MSYELHITRANGWSETEHWSEDKGKRIRFEEWQRLVEDDPDLTIDYLDRLTIEDLDRLVDSHPGFAGSRTEGGFTFSAEQDQLLRELARKLKSDVPVNIEDFRYDTADWTAHPQGEQRCFWFSEGRVSTKNPDVATLDKMLELSRRLNACVRGDDGEIYQRSGLGFECYTLERGWLPLVEHHRGRPDWAPTIIREIAASKP